jgi:hypothetical protein
MPKGKQRVLKNERSFPRLVQKAPHLPEFAHAKLVGFLYRSRDSKKFVLQAPDGTFYELLLRDVKQFAVLEQLTTHIVVQVDLPLQKVIEGAVGTSSRLSRVPSQLPTFASEEWSKQASMTQELATNMASSLADSSIKRLPSVEAEFAKWGESPFQRFDSPFAKS